MGLFSKQREKNVEPCRGKKWNRNNIEMVYTIIYMGCFRLGASWWVHSWSFGTTATFYLQTCLDWLPLPQMSLESWFRRIYWYCGCRHPAQEVLAGALSASSFQWSQSIGARTRSELWILRNATCQTVSGCMLFGCGNKQLSISRKLTSASWSPPCFSKVLGGWKSPIAWNFIVIPPLSLAFSQAVWPWLNPPGTLSACPHWQHLRQHPHPQHHCVFMQSSPAKLAFLIVMPRAWEHSSVVSDG